MIPFKQVLWRSLDRLILNPLLQPSARRLPPLFAASCFLSVTISSCTQPNSANSGNASITVSSNQSQTQPSVIRIGYQKGGIIPISRQRGELDRELAAQNIKIQWSGPFDRCATLLQAIMGDRTDIGGCGDIPSISGIAAGQPLCIGAIQPPKPDGLGSAILVRGKSDIQQSTDLVGKKVAVIGLQKQLPPIRP